MKVIKNPVTEGDVVKCFDILFSERETDAATCLPGH